MAELLESLETLLGGDGVKRAVEMRVVRKYGRPLMLLPSASGAAARTLALYPAQTFQARMARRVLRMALGAGFSVGTQKVSISISEGNSFVRFLAKLAGAPKPAFGVLAGNPNAVGQRLVFLLFDADGNAATVVKVGVTAEAKKLIGQETAFLKHVPDVIGIPRLRDSFESPHAEAFALNFAKGESPDSLDARDLPKLLNAWVKSGRSVRLGETRVWAELRERCGTSPLFAELSKELEHKTVTPAIFHGDLTPWNIKVSSGKWTVFDWERGDLGGIPGYDWFHFAIQPAILVAREPTVALMQRLKDLFASEEFNDYAALTRIAGIERLLAMVYLLHHNEVIRPAEGLKEGIELLGALKAMKR